MAVDLKQIMEKIDHLQSDISYIKKHIVDVDTIPTEDDIEALREAEEDIKAKKTKRL